MLKKLFFILSIFFLNTLAADQGVIGFWKTINDKTGKPESIIGIYQYNGKYYGRIIATYNDDGQTINDTMQNPKDKAPGVEGDAYYSGMDIMWDLKDQGDKFTDGKILDPREGKIYNAEMWLQNNNLVVRGEIWVFGENQTWVPARDTDFPPSFQKPDLARFVPQIPKVKES